MNWTILCRLKISESGCCTFKNSDSTFYQTNHIWVSFENYQWQGVALDLITHCSKKKVREIHIFSQAASCLFVYPSFLFSEEFHVTHANLNFILKMICLSVCQHNNSVWRLTSNRHDQQGNHKPSAHTRLTSCLLFEAENVPSFPQCSQTVSCFLTRPCHSSTPRTNLSCLSPLSFSLVLWDAACVWELRFFSKKESIEPPRKITFIRTPDLVLFTDWVFNHGQTSRRPTIPVEWRLSVATSEVSDRIF